MPQDPSPPPGKPEVCPVGWCEFSVESWVERWPHSPTAHIRDLDTISGWRGDNFLGMLMYRPLDEADPSKVRVRLVFGPDRGDVDRLDLSVEDAGKLAAALTLIHPKTLRRFIRALRRAGIRLAEETPPPSP